MRCDVTSLAGLPPEAVLRIIYFMQPLDMLRLACTCTALRDTILDEGLWARLCRSRWYRFAHANSAPCAPSWRHLFFGGNNWDESELLSSVVRQYDDFHAIEFEPPSSQAAGALPPAGVRCTRAGWHSRTLRTTHARRSPVMKRGRSCGVTGGPRGGCGAGSTLLTATRTWPANRVTVEAFEPTVDSAGKCRGMRQTFRTSLPPSFAVHGLTRLEHEKVLVSTSAIGGGAALAVLQNHQGAAPDMHLACSCGAHCAAMLQRVLPWPKLSRHWPVCALDMLRRILPAQHEFERSKWAKSCSRHSAACCRNFRSVAGYSSDHVATVAGLAAQPLESPGAAAHSSQAWGFTARRTGRASGVVAVDLETHTATSCHDLMSYSFCAWCKHPVDEQVRAALVSRMVEVPVLETVHHVRPARATGSCEQSASGAGGSGIGICRGQHLPKLCGLGSAQSVRAHGQSPMRAQHRRYAYAQSHGPLPSGPLFVLPPPVPRRGPPTIPFHQVRNALWLKLTHSFGSLTRRRCSRKHRGALL